MSTLTPLRVLGAAITASAAYGAYEIHRLRTLYPIQTAPYPPPLDRLFPPGWSEAGYVTTTIPLPPKLALADPLKAFTDAFYETWTLRLEDLFARKTGTSSTVPAYIRDLATSAASGPLEPFRFCSGLFQGIYRDTNNLAVFWCLDDRPGQEFGGIQVLSAQIQDGEMVVSFGGRELQSPFGRVTTAGIYWFHQMYTRFLVDRAKSRLERWAREGR